MGEAARRTTPRRADLTARIVTAYVSRNALLVSELEALIVSIHTALTAVREPQRPTAKSRSPIDRPTAAQIRRSLAGDGIVSFIDGQTYKVLKRHLSKHGLTPYDYRKRYGLPFDYPIVAPEYSARRSIMARSSGLGRVAKRSGGDPNPIVSLR